MISKKILFRKKKKIKLKLEFLDIYLNINFSVEVI